MKSRFCLAVLCLLFSVGIIVAENADSLQIHLHHGLDEMGAGSIFFMDVDRNFLRVALRSNLDALYRRPGGSQGELKTNADFDLRLYRSLHDKFDVEAVFSGDFYHFERFSGPDPYDMGVLSPPFNWEMQSPAGSYTESLQKIEKSLVGVGGTYKPDTVLTLTSVLGQQWERRAGFDDYGLSASFEAELDDFEYYGYHNNLDLYFEQEELGARTNREIRFGYGMDKQFSQNSSDRLEVLYHHKRYDYHIWGTNSIGRRTDSQQILNNQLIYDPLTSIKLHMDTQLAGSTHKDRTATAENTRDEFTTSNALTLLGDYETIAGWTRLKFDWGAQEDATGLKRDRGTSLEGNFSWTPSEEDSLAFLTALRKRQYDTSDTANYDDRDRLRYEVDLAYKHEFSPYFRALARVQTTLEHLVYIYGEKSDQNRWNRIFKLRPEISFEPHPDWSNIARFELVANTTDYDFELDPDLIKSTIFRRYTASDIINWDFNRRWTLSLSYTLDLEDGGRFLWNEWIQQISEEYQTHHMTLLIMRQTHREIFVDAGLSMYERKGWEYYLDPEEGTVKSPFFYLSRWGPVIQLNYITSNGLNLRMDGDLSWVHEWNKDDYTLVNLDITLSWR
ncbi:hypothetical protein CEE37_04505 [candidate division LCP-89 bacterium B3_LCP]|uniref:TIGR03016 family PEP-CTERM system-associated outer membrane protein n=1 Tax=candidate division LCP-89 bacterium B3_LCP TaxID=2012998 RepID=A0A532V3N8_UNCL8|nr:MAG: hypothetical protein CEE37_04505 [candidate division LCP-89 bacterium B3_LCP]